MLRNVVRKLLTAASLLASGSAVWAAYAIPMKADTGPTDTVTGSSKAMVRAGPIPGRIPMAVPNTDPTKAHIKLVGVKATSKP